jgi:hypothetical protein
VAKGRDAPDTGTDLPGYLVNQNSDNGYQVPVPGTVRPNTNYPVQQPIYTTMAKISVPTKDTHTGTRYFLF